MKILMVENEDSSLKNDDFGATSGVGNGALMALQAESLPNIQVAILFI